MPIRKTARRTVPSLSRRQFFRRTALLGAGVLGFPAVVSRASPNSLLQVAAIGVGNMGGRTMMNVATHPRVKITALCDVNQRYLAAAGAEFPEASRDHDWREMLSRRAGTFDAVTIGTPDHMHAAPALIALRARKHVFLQKPMAATLHECRVLTREAAMAGVITQLGNQGRSSIEDRMTVALLRGGVIGRIKEVILWENKRLPWWPKNTRLRTRGDPVPEHLDWDLWLGVREERPYLERTFQPKMWRAWFDFGSGALGDMGCHHFDTTFDALNLSAPLRVRQTTPGSDGPLWSRGHRVEMIYAGTEMTAGPVLPVTWHDGDVEPDRRRITLPARLSRFPTSGAYWVGEHGAIFKVFESGRPFVLPEETFPTENYPRGFKGQDHYHEWVNAVLEGRPACSDFLHSGPLTEAVLVGVMADRFAGKWLHWDNREQEFTGNARATALVKRAYREGWNVAGLG